MIYKIADLIVEVPNAGGLAPRCGEYFCDTTLPVDMTIDLDGVEDLLKQYPASSYDLACYVYTASVFCNKLLDFNGMYLHSSAVEYEGKAYLFSGPSTVGKSTHTRLWQQLFGEAVRVINDDKPALRLIDGKWYAYGTPWCGKDGINQNRKAPLAGICFLKQSKAISIRKLSAEEAIQRILSQSVYWFDKPEQTAKMLDLVDNLLRNVPVYELENIPVPEAALLSYRTMSGAENE